MTRRFYIPLKKSRYRIKVLIFENRKKLNEYVKRKRWFPREVEAFCHCDCNAGDTYSTILVYEGGFGVGLVAHETLHALLFYVCRILKMKQTWMSTGRYASPQEEFLCDLMHETTVGFWKRYSR